MGRTVYPMTLVPFGDQKCTGRYKFGNQKCTARYNQCCREILFLFNRLFRDISRNEDLIAIFISRYIINIYCQLIISYSLLWWLIMATKVNAKPALVATKDEFVCVDRKVYKSSVWQYFGWHKKAIGSCWVVCNICYGWVSRHGNNTSNMRYHITSVHGIKALQQG